MFDDFALHTHFTVNGQYIDWSFNGRRSQGGTETDKKNQLEIPRMFGTALKECRANLITSLVCRAMSLAI